MRALIAPTASILSQLTDSSSSSSSSSSAVGGKSKGGGSKENKDKAAALLGVKCHVSKRAQESVEGAYATALQQLPVVLKREANKELGLGDM